MTLKDYVKERIIYLHSTIFILKRNRRAGISRNILFTFYYIYIKTLGFEQEDLNIQNLHSTIFILKLFLEIK